MLRKLTLTNFRRHTDLTLNFTEGLNVARGVNECGKSTLVESVQYALYGSRLLRTPLDQTVTWGQKPATLKVVLELEAQGKTYTFTRSAAGAEVTHQGKVLVTGQSEVADFATNLLGADGRAVQRLLFAGQNNIRGALEEGPKAVATQIETLCDFDIFDQIIERMQEKLVIGSPNLLEARLREAEDALAGWAEPPPPNLEALRQEGKDIQTAIRVKQHDLDLYEKGVAEKYAVWQNAENAQRMHTTLATNLRKQEEDLRLHEAQLAKAEERVAKRPDASVMRATKVGLDGAQRWEMARNVFQKFVALIYPTNYWEGDRESLNAEMKDVQENISIDQEAARQFRTAVAEAEARITLLESKIITALICPTCKQEVRNKDEILAQNEQIKQQIEVEREPLEKLREGIDGYDRSAQSLKKDLTELEALVRTALPFETLAQQHGEFIDADLAFVPPKLAWKGEAPGDTGPNTALLKQQMADMEALLDDARKAEGQAEALRQAIATDREAVARAKEQLAQYPEMLIVEDLKRAHTLLTNQVIAARADIQVLRDAFAVCELRMSTAASEYETELARGVALRGVVQQAQQDLQTLSFNNALLKKIRAIRPLVADRLWNQVLAAVGTLFSQIRGEKSIVTKDKDGFKVNGQAVESLSGSTLDALGLAIRTALIKTFIPHTSFVVLDEPAHGCDQERTTNMLGFLASMNFDQLLLITHEDISETFADNLITLS